MATPSFQEARRLVLKVGTGVLTAGEDRVYTDRLAGIAEALARWRVAGREAIIVSSGAIGLGRGRLGLTKKPRDLATLQACAAVGQSALLRAWQEALAPHDIRVAQVLLTRDDLRSRRRHIAIRNTLDRLLALGVVPVINENDTVATDEITFGDNDVLSALVAIEAHAGHLVILSTAPGLLDPRTDPPVVIPEVTEVTPEIESLASEDRSSLGTGGMRSKLVAARHATRAGVGVTILAGTHPERFAALLRDEPVEGTRFLTAGGHLHSRQHWIGHLGETRGTLTVDAGAAAALREGRSSLLAPGVLEVTGDFVAGELVAITDATGTPIARGLAQLSAEEVRTALNTAPADRGARLIAVHRNDLVLAEPAGE